MRLSFLLAILLVPQLAVAQAPTAADNSDDLPVPSWGRGIIDAFNKPVHPIVGGVASGGGVGVGVGYDSPDGERWYQNTAAMVTVRRYWSLEGETGIQSRSRQSKLGVFGEVRHMGRLDYFGLGPDSRRENRSAFRLRETSLGTRGWVHLVPALRVGGSASIYMPDLGPGASPSVVSLERAFGDLAAATFSNEPTFGRYRGFAEFVYPAVRDADTLDDLDRYRGTYQVALEAVRDMQSGRYSFNRWETEVQQRIPGFRAGHRLTLHSLIALTEQGADVPFYMLYTLGGTGGLKAFRADTIGSDGTKATLRSFRNYRFRDRDMLLMQAEYRIPLLEKVHATVFVDAGQVAPRPSDLFNDIRTGTGFSLAYMRKGRSLARVDVGYGSGEGIQVFWSFGGFQP